MKNINLLVWGWVKGDCQTSVLLAEELYPLTIKLWFNDTPNVSHPFESYLYRQPDFGQLTATPKQHALSDSEIVQFLERFSREKRSKGLDYHDQVHLAKNYLAWFLHTLKQNKIDHILFELIPLTGIDYVLYLAAKRLSIKNTCCFPSIFPNRFFYCHDINDFGCFDQVESRCDGSIPSVQWEFKQKLFYMEDINYDGLYGKPWPRFLHECWRHGLRESKKPQRMSGVVESFAKGLEFQRNYEDLALTAEQVDLRANFVYFPLHLQPEMTTAALGAGFNDQLDALERLSLMIPEDWLIYAKENPKQGCEQRGPEFFHRLKTMSKVRYLRKDIETTTLLESCRFVSTITGTVGWEAVLGGKPCLVFGLAWYAGMPGVARYSEAITTDDILAMQPTRQQNIDHLKYLYSKTREGIFDMDYTAIYSDYSPDQNAKVLARFIGDIVCREA